MATTTQTTKVDPFGFEIDADEYDRLQADLDRAWEPPVLLDGDLELYEDPDAEW